MPPASAAPPTGPERAGSSKVTWRGVVERERGRGRERERGGVMEEWRDGRGREWREGKGEGGRWRG